MLLVCGLLFVEGWGFVLFVMCWRFDRVCSFPRCVAFLFCLIGDCLLCDVCGSVFVVRSSSLVVRCLLVAVCCCCVALFGVVWCCLLFVMRRVLFVVVFCLLFDD